jgi:hypothetical protein
MNLYTDTKVNRLTGLSWLPEIPAAVFQSLNAGYIIIFGTLIGGFWIWWKKKGKESSSIFKMALGTMIMGLGYVFMMFASNEASSVEFGKAAMVWVFLAYLLHTIGELCTSPVSLSFITKLAPLKYASIMMGDYFAATGFGNKLAGSIGESSQLEPYQGTMIVDKQEIYNFTSKDSIEYKDRVTKEITKTFNYPIEKDRNFSIKADVYLENNEIVFNEYKKNNTLNHLFSFNDNEENNFTEDLKVYLTENDVSKSNPYHTALLFEKNKEKAKLFENEGDGKDYEVSFVIEEEQSEKEYDTFKMLVIFTVAFGLLLLLFLKKLKRLTHGAEDDEHEIHHDEAEGFELADKQ